jgi:sarcosine oxidase subunit beta
MFVSADIVIIGGGITGISTAYFLAQKGQAQVVLLEKDLLAQASTGLCVGGIRQQFTHPANILLSQKTIRFLEKLKKDSQTDIGFHQVGYLFLAQKQKTWEDFLDSVPIQRAYNVPVEVLSPGEIKERWPYLRVDDLMGGTFGPDDGYVDPYRLAMALANRARDSGALILENTEVKEILIRQNRVEGVETTQGTVSAQKVVNAAGAWGRKIAQMAGIDLPVRPFRRQVFATKPFDAAPKPVPMVIDQDTLSYFRGDGPGLLLGMSDPSEPPSFFTHVDRSFLEKVIVHALHRAPILGKAKILRGWGGLYAITPDENPIIGEIPEVKGFVCATGFSGHGFQHGPSVGRILSELLLKGDTQFDLSPFAPDRFKKRKKTIEKRTV